MSIRTNSSTHPALPPLQPGETRTVKVQSSATLAIQVIDALNNQLQTINGQRVAHVKPTEDKTLIVRLYVPYRITGTDYMQPNQHSS